MYPMHEKLKAHHVEHQTLVDFLEWYKEYCQRRIDNLPPNLVGYDYSSGYDEEDGRPRPKRIDEMADRDRGSLLALFFEIDEKAFQEEKDHMIKELQDAQGS